MIRCGNRSLWKLSSDFCISSSRENKVIASSMTLMDSGENPENSKHETKVEKVF